MNDVELEVRVEPSGDGRLRVVSPAVGWWSDIPPAGRVLGAGSPAGRLWQLNRVRTLRLPDGTLGRVTAVDDRVRSAPVEHGQTLFELEPLGDVTAADPASGAGPGAALGAGQHAVVAPTDGIFYQRPAPNEPAFVQVGQRIRTGQPVGLVEVMKTFNQILYGAPGLPAEAEVTEIRCDDAQEVSAGDVLIVVSRVG